MLERFHSVERPEIEHQPDLTMKPDTCPICNFDSIHQVHCSHCGQSVCRDCLTACFECNNTGLDNRSVAMKCPSCKEPTFRYSDTIESPKQTQVPTVNATRTNHHLSVRLRDYAMDEEGEVREAPPSNVSQAQRDSLPKQHVPHTFASHSEDDPKANAKPKLVWFQSTAIGNVWWPATLYSSHLAAHPLMKQDGFCSPFQNEIMKQYILEVSGFPCKPVVCLFGHPDEDAESSSQSHNTTPTWWYPIHPDALAQPFTLANLGDFFADAPTEFRERLQRIMSSRVVPLLTDDDSVATQRIETNTARASSKPKSSIFRTPPPPIEVSNDEDTEDEELLVDRLPAKANKSHQEVTELLSKLDLRRGRASEEDELLRRATNKPNLPWRSPPPGPRVGESSPSVSSSRRVSTTNNSTSNSSPLKAKAIAARAARG